MGDVARISIINEDILYKLFGVNAELLIDHSWGWEPCTIKSIKDYKPNKNSISIGQVLKKPYNYENTKIIVKEMAEQLSLNLTKKNLVTSQIVLTIGYDINNLKNMSIKEKYKGEIVLDIYGRKIPKHAHGTINLESKTNLAKYIMENAIILYDKIVNKNLYVRRINIVANDVENSFDFLKNNNYEQMSLFVDYDDKRKNNESKIQKTIIYIKEKYGKNAILKCMDLQEMATTFERNNSIGGHRS